MYTALQIETFGGSIKVSGKLPTHPLTSHPLTSHLGQNDGLGEG